MVGFWVSHCLPPTFSMATWNATSKNSTTWNSIERLGGGWTYNDNRYTYNESILNYNSRGTATSFTNASKSSDPTWTAGTKS